MAHKTRINGTIYNVQGGKCRVNGTGYDVKKGRTLINGTGYDITFAPPMPVKGDLITMNLDGTDRLYRVLKIVNETVVEVLTMWNLSTRQEFHTSRNDYGGSYLDRYLNRTWYNTLSTAAKAAIVAKNNINQYQYSLDNDYGSTIHASWAKYSSKTLKYSIGERYVYALDVEDIEMYFGGTGGSVNDKNPATFSETDLLIMFWNQESYPAEMPWLRSAYNGNSKRAWAVRGTRGVIDYNGVDGEYEVRGAFQIDLSKINFTTN